eukprot:gene10829-16915_t
MIAARHLAGCSCLPALRLAAPKLPSGNPAFAGVPKPKLLHTSMQASTSRPKVVVAASSDDDAEPAPMAGNPFAAMSELWEKANTKTRIMVACAIPAAWIITTSALWASMMKFIGDILWPVVGPVLSPVTTYISENILDVAQYRMLQVFSLPTTGKLWAVFAVGAPVVFLGGWAYRLVTGESWGDSVAKSYFTLNNVPGMDCTTDENPMGGFVLNCIHIFSLFTFAILVGILTDDIGSAVEEVQSGNFAVPEQNHTVLIGWNKQTIPVLQQIMKQIKSNPNGVFTEPVLILAKRDKADMDDELMEEFGEKVVGKTILTRNGHALHKHDLERVVASKARTIMWHDMERVAASKARTIMWMQPDHTYMKELVNANSEELEDIGEGADSSGKQFLPYNPRLVSSLATIQTLGLKESAPQNLVLQSRDMALNPDPALKVVLNRFNRQERKYTITQVTDMRSLTEVMAQCASQPGLADVFEALFERSADKSPEFKLVPVGHMAGWTFGEVRISFPGHTAVFGTLVSGLNPPDEYIMEAHDKVIVLSLEDVNKGINASRQPQAKPVLPAYERVKRIISPRHFVVLAHGGDPTLQIQAMQESVDQESKVASTITVLTNEPFLSGPRGTKKVRVKYMSGDLGCHKLMLKAGVDTADSVVMHLMSEHDPAEADAQALATVVMLQGLLKESKAERQHSLGVICCVNDRETRSVLKHLTGSTSYSGRGNRLHVDCIEPDKLLSGILTQVASLPALQAVFADIFDADGNGLTARQETGWDVITEIVRAEGDLLIGYVDRSWLSPIIICKSPSVNELEFGCLKSQLLNIAAPPVVLAGAASADASARKLRTFQLLDLLANLAVAYVRGPALGLFQPQVEASPAPGVVTWCNYTEPSYEPDTLNRSSYGPHGAWACVGELDVNAYYLDAYKKCPWVG